MKELIDFLKMKIEECGGEYIDIFYKDDEDCYYPEEIREKLQPSREGYDSLIGGIFRRLNLIGTRIYASDNRKWEDGRRLNNSSPEELFKYVKVIESLTPEMIQYQKIQRESEKFNM